MGAVAAAEEERFESQLVSALLKAIAAIVKTLDSRQRGS